MRLMITDSGLGGLSVCAGIEEKLRSSKVDLEILYINANPEADGGYNSLPTQNDRIDMFDRFLEGSYSIYGPDRIAIACNTLSVIYDETNFSKEGVVAVDGIVDAAVRMSEAHLSKHSDQGLIVFATETTTEAGTYPKMISPGKQPVIPQACPDLASAITSDASGDACRKMVKEYAREALNKFNNQPESVAGLLACTHYGYQSRVFAQVLKTYGVQATILDPNTLMVDQLIDEIPEPGSSTSGELSIRFISRFPVPDVEIASVSTYLSDRAPLTLNSLRNQEIQPDLFQSK